MEIDQQPKRLKKSLEIVLFTIYTAILILAACCIMVELPICENEYKENTSIMYKEGDNIVIAEYYTDSFLVKAIKKYKTVEDKIKSSEMLCYYDTISGACSAFQHVHSTFQAQYKNAIVTRRFNVIFVVVDEMNDNMSMIEMRKIMKNKNERIIIISEEI